MDLREAESRLTDLHRSQGFPFIYSLLEAYGFPKASITRLKSGDFNTASEDNELLWRNRVWFRHMDSGGDLHVALDDAQRNTKVLAARPRFLIVTSDSRLVAADQVTGQTLDISTAELPRHVAFFWPWTGAERTVIETDRQADIKAAQRMAKLYEEVRRRNNMQTEDDAHELNVFFCRLLFCFFAEDTGIFTKGAFTNALASLTTSDGSDLAAFLDDLFGVLNTEESVRSADVPEHFAGFPWVNGDLFKYRTTAPHFTTRARSIILECAELDWSEISPDIFGSMMQSVVLVSDRKDVGMHYTSPANIMKVLRPLFLDDLDAAYIEAQDDAKKLDKLRQRLAGIKVFDPACGSGNFLVLCYKELRELENRILQRKLDILGYESGLMFTDESVIKLDHFLGIDVDEFATEVARLSLWLAKHQMNLRFRELFSIELMLVPLKDGGRITCGNATRLDWNDVCPVGENDEVYVCGNPPYLGGNLQSPAQKQDLRLAFGETTVNMYLDYVSIWILKGAKFAANTGAIVGFVATNSICQGNHVHMLWPHVFDQGVEIAFAEYGFRWANEAPGSAGVICIVVGLARNGMRSKKRFVQAGTTRTVEHINAYLVPNGPDVIVAATDVRPPHLPKMVFGSMPRGDALVLTFAEKNALLEQAPESSKFIRRYLGAMEFVKGTQRYCLWIDDNDRAEAELIPAIAKRLQRVAASRASSKAPSTRSYAKFPHRFVQRAHRDTAAVIVPAITSENREYVPIGYLDAGTVISNKGFAVYDAEPWIFGLLQSRMHMVWIRAVAGRLKTDINYASTLVYNTFPVPELNSNNRAALTERSFDVLRTREQFFDRTIAQLYDTEGMPQLLREAHQRLDGMVDGLYRKRTFDSDGERLSMLFEMYTARSESQQANKNETAEY